MSSNSLSEIDKTIKKGSNITNIPNAEEKTQI